VEKISRVINQIDFFPPPQPFCAPIFHHRFTMYSPLRWMILVDGFMGCSFLGQNDPWSEFTLVDERVEKSPFLKACPDQVVFHQNQVFVPRGFSTPKNKN
jgi:hypothetical protein